MRIFAILLKLFGLLMTILTPIVLMALGASLFVMTKWDLYQRIDEAWLDLLDQLPEGLPYRQILGALIAVAGVLVVFSWLVRRKPKRRSISFVGMHGEVTIELQHVEGTLEAVAKKLPEVKSIAVHLQPTDRRQRVLVKAEAVLLKDADTEARMVTDRVQDYLKLHARKILGVQDVDVELLVRKMNLNLRSIKPMPLMLEAPASLQASNEMRVVDSDGEPDDTPDEESA